MKKHLLYISITVTLLCTNVFAQVNMPAPSPFQMISQDFGMGKIELSYSRPSLRGRELLKDNSEIVPLGKLWRTGANAATKIRFTDAVIIGGRSLDTGAYVLTTIPYKNEWEIILNKGANPGTESENTIRFKVPSAKLKDEIETFTMQFANIKPESCELHLMWGTTAVKVPVTTNIKDRLRTQIETALRGEKKPYQQAASFYYEWDKDNSKALDNINQAIAANQNGFFLYLTKAKIQRDMGDKAGAKASALKCIELATASKNDDYVRQANGLIKNL